MLKPYVVGIMALRDSVAPLPPIPHPPAPSTLNPFASYQQIKTKEMLKHHLGITFLSAVFVVFTSPSLQLLLEIRTDFLILIACSTRSA